MAVFAIRGDDVVVGRKRLHHADADGFFADIEVQEAANLLGAVRFGTLIFEAPDQEHAAQDWSQSALARGVHEAVSRVEISPSGRPSSRALSRRRMILPLFVRGRCCWNSSSLGAIGRAQTLAPEADQFQTQLFARLEART